MIAFKNVFEKEAPIQILIEIDAPDAEGWRKYGMTIVVNHEGDKLVEFGHSFSTQCINRLRNGLQQILDKETDRFEFEPMEPAFRLTVARLNPKMITMGCIVDVSYIHRGPATETGVGVSIIVPVEDVEAALAELK